MRSDFANAKFDQETELTENVRKRFFIGGRWVESHSVKRVMITAPDTEVQFVEVPLADEVDVDVAVASARTAFDTGSWSKLTALERAGYLQKLAGEIRKIEPLFARCWTAQVGAPASFCNMFVPFAAATFDYYAELITNYAFEDTRKTTYGNAHVIRAAVGVAVLITPWNAPLPILSYKLAAALAAGCTTVIKSSPETPFEALLLAECAEKAGIPAGVINVITADRDVGAYLVAVPAINKVSFTGSTAAGKQIAKTCIDRMTRFTLELGGKSAAIILDDTDLGTTLGALAPFTMPFSGQICFAQTRLIVPRRRLEEISSTYADAMNALTVGNPWLPTTHIGPLSSGRQLARALDYIELGKAGGARLLTGGSRSEGFAKGYYVQPTVFS